jgi:phospholipase C
MHPSHDVRLSDNFLGQIYNAVRSSPQYNETALIVMMDEHGEFDFATVFCCR